jgi:hypothetical protein
MPENILTIARDALVGAAAHVKGTDAEHEVARALAELDKVDIQRATVGTSSGFNMSASLWTFRFEHAAFWPGVGRYYIVPARDNLLTHPPGG